MAACTVSSGVQTPVRVLCLGNDLLADDAFGCVVGERLRKLVSADVDVVVTANTGFCLLDFMLGAHRLVVVDSALTGSAEPGTVMLIRAEDARVISGSSPHYIGLFEALALADELELPAPEEVVIIAVEVADCTTIGGSMTAAVEAAVPAVLEIVRDMIESAAEWAWLTVESPRERAVTPEGM
jgi:hydrogenase maturation protease